MGCTGLEWPFDFDRTNPAFRTALNKLDLTFIPVVGMFQIHWTWPVNGTHINIMTIDPTNPANPIVDQYLEEIGVGPSNHIMVGLPIGEYLFMAEVIDQDTQEVSEANTYWIYYDNHTLPVEAVVHNGDPVYYVDKTTYVMHTKTWEDLYCEDGINPIETDPPFPMTIQV